MAPSPDEMVKFISGLWTSRGYEAETGPTAARGRTADLLLTASGRKAAVSVKGSPPGPASVANLSAFAAAYAERSVEKIQLKALIYTGDDDIPPQTKELAGRSGVELYWAGGGSFRIGGGGLGAVVDRLEEDLWGLGSRLGRPTSAEVAHALHRVLRRYKEGELGKGGVLATVEEMLTSDLPLTLSYLRPLIRALPGDARRERLSPLLREICVSGSNLHYRLFALRELGEWDPGAFKDLYPHILESETENALILYAVEKMRDLKFGRKEMLRRYPNTAARERADRRLGGRSYTDS
jgi:hypothetical protein